MTTYEVHEPTYSGRTTDDWSAPRQKDFVTDDLAEIGSHYLLSASGFRDPADFDDLKLPVVDADGDLNLNALETAHGGAHGVEAVDGIDDGTVDEVREIIEDLAEEEFGHQIGSGDD